MNLKIFKGFEKFEECYPTEAVKYALENKEEAIPELLEILEYTLSDVENLAEDDKYLLQFPALYILAYFREKKAYESIIKLASLPDEQLFDLLGDTVTEDFKNIIASVCDGNIEPIKGIIENSSLDEYVRTEALESLLILLNNGIVSREQLVAYFEELFNGKLEIDYSNVWDTLPRCCSLIHPAELVGYIEKAVVDEKVMKIIADLDFMDAQLEKSVEEVLNELKEDEHYSFITEKDVLSLEQWVGNFDSEDDYDEEGYPFDEDDENELLGDSFMSSFYNENYDEEILENETVRRESFVGRNDPCPCGSGKKYKKCCLGKA